MKFILIVSFFISLSFPIDHPSHGILDDWNVLQGDDYKIWVGWLETSDIDWCRTQSTIPYGIDKVSRMIEDLENYYNIFDRVKSSILLDSNVVHIRIDMPFPISDRDYIVKYKTNKYDNHISYKFEADTNTKISTNEGCIRLVNAAGEWYLKTVDENSTKVVYTWNGELAGDFPEWALTKAWSKQGNEMIEWLTESLEELYKD